MSFALEVKEELTRLPLTLGEELMALKAILHNGFELNLASFNDFKLLFQTKSNPIMRYVIKLLTNIHPNIKYNLYQKQIMRFDKPNLYVLEINNAINLVEEFELLKEEPNNKLEIYNEDNYKKIYLRASFITSGSVNDPKTSNYHLEWCLQNDNEALFIQSLINSYDLNARISKRKEKYVIYIKDRDGICDLLRIIGVNVAVFNMEQDIIKRNMIAKTKREINFDIANQSKTNNASKNIIRYIKYLEKYYPLDDLDDKLKIVMKIRKENPESSLVELCKILEDEYKQKITKSCLNHRLRKIKEIAIEYSKKRNNNDWN